MKRNHSIPNVRLRSRQEQGSALLLVMWATLFMSLTVMGVIEFASFGMDDRVSAQRDFRARQLAESGLSIGLHPAVQPNDPVLVQDFPDTDEGFEVHIRYEDGRIPINTVLQLQQTDWLRELFEKWGMTTEDAAVLADSLADWVDRDSSARINGAENDYYVEQGHPDYPHNQPFQSVDEMAFVRGIDRLEDVKPDWRNEFTVYGSGKLNVNSATSEVIQMATGVSEQQADALIQLRNGPDGVPDTEDDYQFRSLNEVAAALGMNAADFSAIASRLTVQPTVIRVESKGRVADCVRTISVIARIQPGKQPIYLARTED